MIWIGAGIVGLIAFSWLVGKIPPASTLPPSSSGGADSSRVPRNPRPVVRTGAAEEPTPKSFDED